MCKSLWLVLICTFSASASATPDTKVTIQNLVRSAVNSRLPISAAALGVNQSNPAVREWIAANRESLDGTRGGPFDPTAQYVSTYAGNKVFVHILDWQGKNNLFLPAILDRPILSATLMHTGPQHIGDGYPRVDQHPWGTLIVVPENERPDDVDTILIMTIEDAATLVPPRLVQEDPVRGLMLMGDTAKVNGAITYAPSPDWLENWTTQDESATWRVQVRRAGDYKVALTYSCAQGCGGAKYEITSGSGKLVGTLCETSGTFGDWLNFEKLPLDGSLHLHAGINQISLRPISKAKTNEILRLYAVYLVNRREENTLAAESARARQIRVSSEWLKQAKYGVMVHWIAATVPRSGSALPFCDAVQNFNVERFADTVKETGAAYLIFTLVHGIQKFPIPLKSVDAILPGRTCARDLISDLAKALTNRGIKLILYCHDGVGDPDWSRASGFLNKDKSAFFGHEAAILQEIGKRYGSQVAGWWFDDRYPLQPFEQLEAAAKAGNPERLVAFNSWVMPRSTDFQDYWAGELGGNLLPLPAAEYFDHGGPQDGLQPHTLIFLDDPWMHGYHDTEIHPPLYATRDLTHYIQDCNRKGAAVTMNMGIYQEGTVSQPTIDQLVSVRREIRDR